MSSLKLALVTAIVLVLVGPAAAGGRVDWSDYIDHDAKPMPVAAAESPAPEAPARTKKSKASRVKKKVAKSKASKKARKGKARRK